MAISASSTWSCFFFCLRSRSKLHSQSGQGVLGRLVEVLVAEVEDVVVEVEPVVLLMVLEVPEILLDVPVFMFSEVGVLIDVVIVAVVGALLEHVARSGRRENALLQMLVVLVFVVVVQEIL